MKRFILSFVAVVISLGSINAQDLEQITEIYNAGATSLSAGNKEEALKSFEKALTLATALGEDGKEVANNCTDAIPSISLSIAKDLVKAADFDGAVAKLNSTIELAKKYSSEEVVAEATELIPQVLISKGDSFRTAKKFAEAAAVYKQVLDNDATNGAVALRLGISLNGAGDQEGAKLAYETAAANGQATIANKQLANIWLKESSIALKEKQYADAIAAALKVGDYAENAQAYQIAGQAAQLSGKNNDAINYFVKCLEIAPTSKTAGQIAYTVGVLYQQAKNNEKAKEYYSMAVSDPKFGAEAQKLLDALK